MRVSIMITRFKDAKKEVKNTIFDEEKVEDKFDKEEMILVGTILCPLKIGVFFFSQEQP